MITDPTTYEAWYKTPRGHWVSECEFSLLQRLMNPHTGESLLDVGCGTGHFTRRFAQAGLSVTGIDPDPKKLDFLAMFSFPKAMRWRSWLKDIFPTSFLGEVF